MVVGSYNYYAFIIGDPDFLYPIVSSSTFYIYAFLEISKDDKMIRKKIFLVFLFIVALLALKEISNNNPFTIIKYNHLENRLSSSGNIFSLRVTYQGLIPAGQARLEDKGEKLYQGRKVYHLSAEAYPLGIYSKFFNARIQVDSYVDTDKLNTLKFKQRLALPNKPQDVKEVLYDQNKHFMELKGVKRQILPGTQDPLSAIFYIRRQNLEIGKVFDININTNQKNYRFYARVTEREEYILEARKIGVWVLKGIIRRRNKNAYHKTTLKLWLLDNPSKIPILVKTMSSIGQVTARLTSVE